MSGNTSISLTKKNSSLVRVGNKVMVNNASYTVILSENGVILVASNGDKLTLPQAVSTKNAYLLYSAC